MVFRFGNGILLRDIWEDGYILEELFIIAGLGNPGRKYEKTRHNMGFDTIDLLAARCSIKVNKVKHKALLGDGSICGRKIVLVKPQTYMNASGESLREIVEWYRIPMINIIIIQDDVDLPVGRIRIRSSGSAGTHNGMRSVIYQLQDDGFPRIKIGVGGPPEGWDLADYVLGRFSGEERKIIDESISRAADAVEIILKDGVDTAMNSFNGR